MADLNHQVESEGKKPEDVAREYLQEKRFIGGETMIEFKNISKSYGKQEIIKDFNLTIECGTFLTIIGSSGSGKTTILKMINGLIKADKGEVLINNKNIQDEDLNRT